MEEQEAKSESGSVRLDSRGARLEVTCGEMHYAFDLILWGDGEVGARCVTRDHFQYVTNKEGFDNLKVDELEDVFNGLLMIHEKTILFLDDNILKGRIAILITAIRDVEDAKSVEYNYKWLPYVPILNPPLSDSPRRPIGFVVRYDD